MLKAGPGMAVVAPIDDANILTGGDPEPVPAPPTLLDAFTNPQALQDRTISYEAGYLVNVNTGGGGAFEIYQENQNVYYVSPNRSVEIDGMKVIGLQTIIAYEED